MTDAETVARVMQVERQVYHTLTTKFTPKPDTGTLFKNGFKKNDSHPDYTGTYAQPDGTVREMAAWINGDYLSIRFSDQYEAAKRA